MGAVRIIVLDPRRGRASNEIVLEPSREGGGKELTLELIRGGGGGLGYFFIIDFALRVDIGECDTCLLSNFLTPTN